MITLLLNVFLASALTIIHFAPAFAAGNDLAKRLKLQQNFYYKQQLLKNQAIDRRVIDALEALPMVPASGSTEVRDPSDPRELNADKRSEAALLYRNLRRERDVTHKRALEILKKKGFPTQHIAKTE